MLLGYCRIYVHKRHSEAVVSRCFTKYVFFKILENSQENTCIAQVFFYEFCKIFKNTFLQSIPSDCFWTFFTKLLLLLSRCVVACQGRSEGTSSIAFQVLIINCEKDFINLFIFNCLRSNINLFLFNYLTSNLCFPKNISFANRRERLFMCARP